MARIAGVDLPKNKPVEIGLARLYGVGRPLARLILTEVGIPRMIRKDGESRTFRVKDLTESQISKINQWLASHADRFKVEGDARREVQQNIRRLMDIGAYRGSRHKKGLPCRGQRTRTNARTRRGARKTVGAAKPGAKRPTAPSKKEEEKKE